MTKHLYFKYNYPPSDVIDEEVHLLPNPQQDIEGFLGWFLKDYQSDERVTHLKDLYNKLQSKKSNSKVEKQSLNLKVQVEKEITILEDDLRLEACENFYKLLMKNTVEIVSQDIDSKEED